MEISEAPAEDLKQAEVVQSNVIKPEILEKLKHRLEKEQNLMLGIVAGVVAGILGAAIWAIVTVTTQYQIGWMAVGVGFIVGYAVRICGRGISSTFGVIGAICALGGCILGNLLSACSFLANQESVSLIQVTFNTLMHPVLCFKLLEITFNPMDLLFYGIAVYGGYQFSFRRITQEELPELVTQE